MERDRLTTSAFLSFLCVSAGKEVACKARDLCSIPGFGRFPGEGKGYLLQYSGQLNSMNCIVHVVAKSQTRLSDFHFTSFLRFKDWLGRSTGNFLAWWSNSVTWYTFIRTLKIWVFHCVRWKNYAYLIIYRPAPTPKFSVFFCCCSVTKLCPTLCDPMGCSPPGSSVHGFLQTGILEWVVISISRFLLLLRYI